VTPAREVLHLETSDQGLWHAHRRLVRRGGEHRLRHEHPGRPQLAPSAALMAVRPTTAAA
jgi:hypothetical protein